MTIDIALFFDPSDMTGSDLHRQVQVEGVTIRPVVCSNAQEFSAWLDELTEKIDGLLFTSEILLRELRSRSLLPPLPCELVQPSESDILRVLMQRAGGVYSGNLSRIMIDIGPAGEVLNEVLSTQFRPMIVSREIWRAAQGETFEESLLRRYRVAWNCSSFDLIIIDQSRLLKPMTSEGINVWCVRPGSQTMRRTIEKMALSIMRARERNHNPVFVVIGARSGQMTFDHLREAVEACNISYGKPFLIMRRGSVLELSAFGFSRKELIQGRIVADISARLTDMIGEPAVVGWGIGVSVPHARDCAEKAYRESMLDPETGSFLVDEKSDLFGPFYSDALSAGAPQDHEYLRSLGHKAGVSAATAAKLLRLIDRVGREDVTSEKIARTLGMTQRSASRLLANLVEHGMAELCEAKSDSLRGRPAKRYRILM